MELVHELCSSEVRALPMLCRLLLVSFGLAQGLLPAVLNARPALALRARVPAMLSPAQEKKASLVEEVKAQMQTSSLLFCVRSEGITVNEMNLQRQKFPDSVKIRCVKNTLIHRAAQDFPDFEVVSKTGGELKFSNYWFFVPEEDMRATVKTWNDFIDESKRVCDPRAPPVRAHPLSAPARRTRPRFRRRSRRSWAACSVATCSMPRALRLSANFRPSRSSWARWRHC